MRERIRKGKEFGEQHISKKLRTRIKIYLGISLVILATVIYEIIIGSVATRIVLIAIIIGISIGLVVYRMYHIHRHEEDKKVISRIDRTGWIILGIYIAFSIFRDKVIEYYFQGPAVMAIIISVVLGLMIGRILGMRKKIFSVLREQQIIA